MNNIKKYPNYACKAYLDLLLHQELNENLKKYERYAKYAPSAASFISNEPQFNKQYVLDHTAMTFFIKFNLDWQIGIWQYSKIITECSQFIKFINEEITKNNNVNFKNIIVPSNYEGYITITETGGIIEKKNINKFIRK